nr:hypothetical protein [Tanacetum cinerariifolium]
MEMDSNIESMTLEEYLRYESEKESLLWKSVRSKGCTASNVKEESEMDIDSMSIEEYELYMAMQYEKDLSLEEILGYLFKIGVENLRRRNQEVLNVCDDKKSRDTDQEDGDLFNFPIFTVTNVFASVSEQVEENINSTLKKKGRKFIWRTLRWMKTIMFTI